MARPWAFPLGSTRRTRRFTKSGGQTAQRNSVAHDVAKDAMWGSAAGGPLYIDPSGIASAESFGTAVVEQPLLVQPTGIGSGEAFGNASVEQPLLIEPASIPSSEAFGPTEVVMAGADLETGFASDQLAQTYFGKSIEFRHPLQLLPINDQNHESRNVEENFKRISEWAKPFGGNQPEAFQLARLLGCAYVTGFVQASLAGDGSGDTRFQHKLGRIPSMVLLSIDQQGMGGAVFGAPSGKNGTSGGNETAWTKTDIYVRASRSSNYAIFIL